MTAGEDHHRNSMGSLEVIGNGVIEVVKEGLESVLVWRRTDLWCQPRELQQDWCLWRLESTLDL